MNLLGARLVGKSIQSIQIGKPGLGIGLLFTDGSGATIHSGLSARLTNLPNSSKIESVEAIGKEIALNLGDGGVIAISIDPEVHEVVEFFLFRDTDGETIVEN